jgi:hypothetical protein
VRVQRIALKDEGDVSIAGRGVRHVFVADADHACVDLFEAGHGAKQGRLAATRRADDHAEDAVVDREVDRVERRHGAEAAAHAFDRQ